MLKSRKTVFNFTTTAAIGADYASILTVTAAGLSLSFVENNWMTETSKFTKFTAYEDTDNGIRIRRDLSHCSDLLFVAKDLATKSVLYFDTTAAQISEEIVGNKFYAYKTLDRADVVVYVKTGSDVDKRLYPGSAKDLFSKNHNFGSDAEVLDSVTVANKASFVPRIITNVRVLKERADLITKGESCKIPYFDLTRVNTENGGEAYKLGSPVLLNVGFDRLTQEGNGTGNNTFSADFFDGPTKIGAVHGGTVHVEASERVLANAIRLHLGDVLLEDFNKPGMRIKVNLRLACILVPGTRINTRTHVIEYGWVNALTNSFVANPSSNYVDYEFGWTSTSEVKGDSKGGISTWIACPTLDNRAFTVIDKVIPNIIKNKVKETNGTMPKNKALTHAARIGLAKLVGKEYNVQSVGEFDGVFDATAATGSAGCFDGAALAPESLGKKMGIDKNALRNLVLQARIYGVYKMQVIFVPDKLYKLICDYLNNERGTITVRGLDNTVKYPEILTDDNVKKATVDIDIKDIVLTVKAVGHDSKGAYLNKQVIQKVLFEAANMGDAMFEQAVKYFKDKGFDTLSDSAIDVLAPAYRPVLGDSEFNVVNALLDGPAVADRKLRNAYIGMAKNINKLHIADDNLFNGVCAGDIACIFGVNVLKDKEILFGRISKQMSRLANNTVAYAEFVAKYASCLIFKYPSMGLYEFLTGTILSTDQVCDRVDADTVLTDSMKDALKEYYTNIADSTLMFAAQEEIFKLLAGMDIDFDKCHILFNDLFNQILGGKEELINISPKRVTAPAKVKPLNVWNPDASAMKDIYKMDDTQVDKFKAKLNAAMGKEVVDPNSMTLRDKDGNYNYNFFFNAYVIYRKMAGSVGFITNANDKIIAMATMAKRGDWSACDQFLKELFGTTTAEEDTFFMDNKDIVDPNAADRAVELMSKCKWTDANKMAFMLFCNRLFRLYQESCIDSTKTGVYIACIITNASIKIRSLVSVRFNYDNNMVEFDTFESRKINVTHVDGSKDEMETMLFEDVMGDIASYLVGEIPAIIGEVKAVIGYSAEELNEFQDNIKLALKHCPGVYRTLHTLKNVHRAIRTQYREDVKALAASNKNEEEREMLMEGYKNHLVEGLAALSSLVKQVVDKKLYRTATQFESFVLCGKILDAIANTKMTAAHEYQQYPGNFAVDCYKESLLAGKTDGSYKLFGTLLQDDFHVLDELFAMIPTDEISLSFVDGVNNSFGSTIVLKERYTGEVKFNGTDLYVEKEVAPGLDELKATAVIVDAVKVDRAINQMMSAKLGKATNAYTINSQITKNSVIQIGNGCMYFWGDRNKATEYITLPVVAEFSNLEVGVNYYVNEVIKVKNFEQVRTANNEIKYPLKDSYYIVTEKVEA